jgi:hypothetical protein
MKRIRTSYGKDHLLIKKSYATLYSICQYIPGCKTILDDYQEENEYDNPLIPGYLEQWPEMVAEMDSLSKEAINNWFSIESPEVISQTLLPLRLNEKHKPFLIALKALAEPEYKFYLESDNCAISRNFAAPSPFFVLPNNIEFLTLTKTKVIKYGVGTMEIDGMVLKAEDCQLLYALMRSMRSRLKRSDESGIHFTISIMDIAKARHKSNPSKLSTQQSIKNGLKRLRGCVLTYNNGKGQWMIGGILNEATKINDKVINIVLSRNYINLLGLGYVDLEPDIYLALSPLEANLYKFLRLQTTFEHSKTLPNRTNRKIYEQAGLGGIDSKNKDDSYIKRKLIDTLTKLQKKGIVDQFSVDLKNTSLWRLDSHTVGNKAITEHKTSTRTKNATKLTYPMDDDNEEEIPITPHEKNTCYNGLKFGVDTEQFDICDTCEVWEDCKKANKNYSDPYQQKITR